MSGRLLERLIIAAVALHSFVLGGAMLLFPVSTLSFFGWSYSGTPFFPSQCGIFLVILGGGYVAAIWRRPFAWFLVGSKAVAVVFLLTHAAVGDPATTPLLLRTALLDGLMGIAVAAIVLRNIRAAGE